VAAVFPAVTGSLDERMLAMAQKPANTGPGAVPTGLIPFDDNSAERLKKIAEAAYRRAQQRNFAPGHDIEDWLEAEKEVDAPTKAGK
jgi:hypothetical protein